MSVAPIRFASAVVLRRVSFFEMSDEIYGVEIGKTAARIAAPDLPYRPPVPRDAAVLPKESNDGLVAYVVVEREQLSSQATIAGELRKHLGNTLPDYMVPSIFVELEALPLTPSGKVNRRALSVPDAYRPESGQEHVAPRDDVEATLVKLWQKVLGLKSVGVKDNFFELGGHSLLASRLFAQIQNTFGRNLPLATLFQSPTVEQLAAVLREHESQGSWSSLVAIQPQGSRPPLFCVHAAGSNVLIYRPLANATRRRVSCRRCMTSHGTRYMTSHGTRCMTLHGTRCMTSYCKRYVTSHGTICMTSNARHVIYDVTCSCICTV